MSDGYLERCAERRARVLSALPHGAALLLPAAPEMSYGRDSTLPYQVDDELYYLTGCTEPESVALLARDMEGASSFTLFMRPRDPAAEVWTGTRLGPDAARERFGADAAHPIGELESRLPALLEGVDTVYFRLAGGRPDMEALLLRAVAQTRQRRPRRGTGPQALVDPGVVLDELRLLKDDTELARLREAAGITVESFVEAAGAIRPGAGEWEVEAALDGAFRHRRGDGPAFVSIVASGVNATVLHYVANERVMADGELVLLDAGARYRHYNGDVSRTFPVSGRFSTEQRELYDVVLAAHTAAVATVRPGVVEADVHAAAVRELVAGLVAMGALSGDVAALAADAEAYRAYYPHRTSHWLGLEVHDVGNYVVGGESRALAPGMVLTIEPGLYVGAGDEHHGRAADLVGTGVRIEDDVLVTADGAEVLTAALPTAAADVQALVGG